jgi:ABC-type sugar transport system substrate-binding protein
LEETSDIQKGLSRKDLIRAGAGITMAGAASGLLARSAGAATVSPAAAGGKIPTSLKTGFSWFLAHPVTKGWADGIKKVLDSQQGVKISYKVLDPEAKADVQVQQVNTMIAQGYNIIWLQPIDSAALAGPVKRARDRGIVLVTINIEANALRSAHVTQPHKLFSTIIGKRMAQGLHGKGGIYLVTNAQGTSIYNARKSGFLGGLKGTQIKVLGEVDGQADAKHAHDAIVPVLSGNKNLAGIWCLNDDMAQGVVQAIREAGRKGIVVWGNGDGEKGALRMIEQGLLAGTMWTDVVLQGQIAGTAGLAFARAGMSGKDIPNVSEIDVPFLVVDKTNVRTIPASARVF